MKIILFPECERNGKLYENGEKIMDAETPCRVCYCQGECGWVDRGRAVNQTQTGLDRMRVLGYLGCLLLLLLLQHCGHQLHLWAADSCKYRTKAHYLLNSPARCCNCYLQKIFSFHRPSVISFLHSLWRVSFFLIGLRSRRSRTNTLCGSLLLLLQAASSPATM